MPFCCVFQPANGGFKHPLLVEIIFNGGLTSFSITETIRNSAKREKYMKKGLGATLKAWQTPKNWSNPGENMTFIIFA